MFSSSTRKTLDRMSEHIRTITRHARNSSQVSGSPQVSYETFMTLNVKPTNLIGKVNGVKTVFFQHRYRIPGLGCFMQFYSKGDSDLAGIHVMKALEAVTI